MPQNGEYQPACHLETRVLVEHGAGGHDNHSAATWPSICVAFQHNPTPTWVYSSLYDRIAWANNSATSLFGRDITQPSPDKRGRASKHGGEGGKPHRVATDVETLGCTMELEFQCGGVDGAGCCFASKLPGWPQHTPESALSRFRTSRNRLLYTAIRVPGQVLGEQHEASVSCCLIQLVDGSSASQEEPDMQRVMAMHEASPIFRFMFDCEGRLLQANRRAIQHCKQQLSGEKLTMWSLFKLGQYASEERRLEDYNQAMDQVFTHHQTFRCQQERRSRKNAGSRKWVELEMWPLNDPVTGQPAVLISQMNMTHTKTVEVTLKSEKEELKTTKEALEAELMDKGRRRSTGRSKMMKSPMQEIVELFDNLAEGGPLPDKDKLLTYRALVAGSANLREPTNIVGELLHDETLEKDVGLSILQQLGYSLSRTDHRAGQRLSRDYTPAFAEHGCPAFGPMSSQSARDFSVMASHAIAAVRAGSQGNDDSILQERAVKALLGISGPKLVPAIERVLATSVQWDFNVFELDEVSQHNPLSTAAFFFLKQTGLVRYFALDEKRLSRWLRTIEEGYPNNPYHNRIHAADVTQKMFVLLTRGGLLQGITHVHQLAALLSAVGPSSRGAVSLPGHAGI
mmetsp:Transcript_21856/g.56912  ORF Transcript_21856/g.56912 Transcript_21856/m.56912 type:complete len:627 (+) Transcript_21856:271-2151(+)